MKAAVERGATAPAAGASPSHSALFSLVRMLARQVARETFPAQQQTEIRAKSKSMAVHDPEGNREKRR